MSANDSFERAEDRSLVEPEPRRRREVDPDSAYDEYRETDEYARNAAIGARSALMREAAWERVAAVPPAPIPGHGGFGWHYQADPVGEWLAENARVYPAQQAIIVRLMVRAMAAPDGPGRDRLMAIARDAALSLAQDCARSIAWDMAEAAVNEEAKR